MPASGNYIVESDVDNWPIAVSASENFATTAVNTTTDQITVTHDIATCTELRFSSTGALPTPLVVGVIYYAIRVDATHIKVALTPVLAAAGTAINLTDIGSGTHTVDIGSGSSEADRQAVIDYAEQLIENITRDYFYAKTFEIYCDGNNKDRLFLGLVPRILNITKVLICGIELSSSWYTFDENSIYLDPEAAIATMMYRIFEYERIFPKGVGNIKVTGTYGWPACPIAIKRAAIILCRYENDNALYPAHSADFRSERLGDYSYTLADNVSSRETTGIDAADRLLRNYIRKKPMLGAV